MKLDHRVPVNPKQRYSKNNPCPICGGYNQAGRGQGLRCFGYSSEDGLWANCTREDYAGGLPLRSNDTYGHRLEGDCRCRTHHNPRPPELRDSTNEPGGRIVGVHSYNDENNNLLFQVVRYEPKGFRQRRPNGNGGWIWNLNGVTKVIYRLPDLLGSDRDQQVFITEGEAHADRLRELGLVATTFPMGALKSHLVKNVSALTDRHVVVLPDNDPANLANAAEHLVGQRHAQEVAQKLHGVADSIRVLELPDLPIKGDVINWIDDGHTAEELLELARRCPEWEPEEIPDATTGGVQLSITNLTSVVPEQVKSLWPKRIFRGKLAVLAGDPGLGKSYASLDIAARTSLGGSWPDRSGLAPMGNVLLVSAEDGLADTVRPRLDLLGADMERIFSLGLTVRDGDQEIGLSLKEHLVHIEELVRERNIILLVIDPLLAFTGRTDTYKGAEVRSLLSPLSVMAERTQCAILAVMHPNKNSKETNALYRVSSSLDFVAAARSVMIVAKHPDNPDQRIMATIKCNLTAHPESLAFGFTSDGHFTWQGVANVDVDHLMAPPVRETERTDGEEAKDFLNSLLANGPVPSTQVEQERKALGISSSTLSRAKKNLGVVSDRSNTEGKRRGQGYWEWRLPEYVADSFKDATPTFPTGGNLERQKAERVSLAMGEEDMFKDTNGNLEDAQPGGNLEDPSPNMKSGTGSGETFKIANTGGQDVAMLNSAVDAKDDTTPGRSNYLWEEPL